MWIFIFTTTKKKLSRWRTKLKQSHCLPPDSTLLSTPHHSQRGKPNAKQTEVKSTRHHQMEESRRSRKEKSGRLEWKRLSELSDSPGTTPGGMLINYLTILQPQKSFLWGCPFVSQRKGLWAWRRRKKGAAVWAMVTALAGGKGGHFSATQN